MGGWCSETDAMMGMYLLAYVLRTGGRSEGGEELTVVQALSFVGSFQSPTTISVYCWGLQLYTRSLVQA